MIEFGESASLIHEYGVNVEERTIYISGEIEANLNILLRVKIDLIKKYYKENNLKLKDINFIVSSQGGDATAIQATLDFYDSLKKEGIVINVLVEGICYSAATFITCYATGTRRASKRTRFLVHEIQISENGGTHTQTKSFQSELNYLGEQIVDTYTQCTLKKAGYYGEDKKTPTSKEYDKVYKAWEKRIQNETYLSAQEACSLGLIDEVV